ncbi:MAG: hypothetical protein CMM01_25855 [Rhodopirellula sp.]|nr:hypothetical protein [Rhodopirellula sp.]OUX49110.1 MAG: hypothetical protein CBE43_10920 [Rhodopirellula sp. TMED283]
MSQDNAYLARQCLFGKTMLIWQDNAYLARKWMSGCQSAILLAYRTSHAKTLDRAQVTLRTPLIR